LVPSSSHSVSLVEEHDCRGRQPGPPERLPQQRLTFAHVHGKQLGATARHTEAVVSLTECKLRIVDIFESGYNVEREEASDLACLQETTSSSMMVYNRAMGDSHSGQLDAYTFTDATQAR
jgi:hypothetical protein